MRRGKREPESRSSFSDYPVKRRARHGNHGNNTKDFHGKQSLVASASVFKPDELTLETSPSLTQMKQARATESDWPWDQAPPGCESISVSALKLFGTISSTSECSVKQLPEELTKLRRPLPLNPENSWVYRKAGGKIYSTIKDAVLASNDENKRPRNLPSFENLSTSSETVLVQNAATLDEIIERYGPVQQHDKLGSSTFIVKFQEKPEKELKEPDSYLNETDNQAHPVVEILNATSLKRSDDRILEVVKALCAELGEPVKRVWMRKREESRPYNLARVFVELADSNKTLELAKQLGQKSIEGRPLITTINTCSDLQ